LGVVGGGEEDFLGHGGWGVVVEADGHPDAVFAGGVVEVDDLAFDHFAVGDLVGDAVVGDEAGGAPVDFADFGAFSGGAEEEPVSDLIGAGHVDADAGDDVREEVLHGEAEDDGGDA